MLFKLDHVSGSFVEMGSYFAGLKKEFGLSYLIRIFNEDQNSQIQRDRGQLQ